MFRKLLLFSAVASLASAATIIQSGNFPWPGGETDVVFTSGTAATAGIAPVSLTSSQTLVSPAPNRTQASTGLLTNISIGLPAGYTFGDVIFNAFCQGAHSGCAPNITIAASDGTTATTSLRNNGQNIFTITGTGLTGVSLSGTAFTDLRNVQLSNITGPGIPPTSGVPEPGTIGMLATGIGAILFGIRRKRK